VRLRKPDLTALVIDSDARPTLRHFDAQIAALDILIAEAEALKSKLQVGWIESATGYSRKGASGVDGHITRLSPEFWGISDGRSFSSLVWTRSVDFEMADAVIAEAAGDPPAHLIGVSS
jgi:hypothetical protein